MMYYINNNDSFNPGRHHEVHTGKCPYFEFIQSKKYLGNFSNCRDAMKEAKKYYKDADGCKVCSFVCHTG